MNTLCLIDAPYENYSKTPGISKKEQNQSTHSVSCFWLTRVYVFHVVQCQVQIKVRIDNDNTKTLSEDSDIDVGIWKSDIYGSLDGLDVSIDGVGNSLFLNLVDMFAESILVLLSLLQLWE